MQYKIWVFAAFLLALPISFAATEFDSISFENNTEVNIIGHCAYFGGSDCDSCFLTAYFPNWTLVVENGTMSYISFQFFNYSLGNLTEIGDYHGSMMCYAGAASGSDDASFRVVKELLYNGGGIDMWMVAIALGFLAMIGTFAYLAVRLDIKYQAFRLFFLLIAIMLMYPFMVFMIQIADTGAAHTVVAATYASFIWILPFVLAMLSIMLVAEKVKEIKIKRAEKKKRAWQ
jgi:hypothetical protein